MSVRRWELKYLFAPYTSKFKMNSLQKALAKIAENMLAFACNMPHRWHDTAVCNNNSNFVYLQHIFM